MTSLPRKTALTFATFGLLMVSTDLVPVLKDYKVMDWRALPAVLDFVDRGPGGSPEKDEQLRLRPETEPMKQAAYPIVDVQQNLDHFYRALHRVESREPGAVTRILHYGDSPTTADLITSDVRLLLQQQFGDAGHGFCLIAKPWAWYSHSGIDIQGQGWEIDVANQGTMRDGQFGLGGVSFRGSPRAYGRVRLRQANHTRAEVSFLQQPGGGSITFRAGGKSLGTIETEAPAYHSGFARFEIPPQTGELTVEVANGDVRLFGMSLEREANGVIYNSLGVNGAYISLLARFFREDHWQEQLRHYRPDLVIVNYGTNESMYAPFVDHSSERETREVIRRLRKALPKTSILVMSPMDRGERMASGEIGTVPTIPRLVAIQERVARETGSAFFNTFAAMGGVGTMARWFEAEPRLVGSDFIHPMPAGARIVGGLLYKALVHDYNRYKQRLLENRTVAGVR